MKVSEPDIGTHQRMLRALGPALPTIADYDDADDDDKHCCCYFIV